MFVARVLWLSLALLGCGHRATAPNLILIAVDTLRADHLGAYGYPRGTSPNIDRLASAGLTFTRASAPSSWTKPSIGSLFTSRLPSEHRATTFARHLSAALPTLAERLRDHGYFTLGVAGNFVHLNEDTGMSRGFERWRTLSHVERGEAGEAWEHEDGRPISLSPPPAGEVNRAVLAELSASDPAAPVFVYVHYMEPHADYDPPEPLRARFVTDAAAHAARRDASSDYLVELAARGRSVDAPERQRLIDLYDAEIAAVDAGIGELLAALEGRGLLDRAVIAIVSDHGEEFGEHGAWFHGISLHGESLYVPLVLHDTRDPRAERRDDPVDLLDVPTTLLHMAGIEPAEGMRGRDLRRDPLPERELVAQLHADSILEERVPRRQQFSLTRWPWKAIVRRDGSVDLYRLDRDPGERETLDWETAAVPPELRQSAETWQRRMAEDPGSAPPIDAEMREGLRALGYAE